MKLGSITVTNNVYNSEKYSFYYEAYAPSNNVYNIKKYSFYLTITVVFLMTSICWQTFSRIFSSCRCIGNAILQVRSL